MSAYDQTIQLIKGSENVLGDCLHCFLLPLSAEQEEMLVKVVESHSFDPCQIMPIQSSDVSKASKYDPVVSTKAMSFTVHGWPSTVNSHLILFQRIYHELSIEHGCLWGNRVVILRRFQKSPTAGTAFGAFGHVKNEECCPWCILVARFWFWCWISPVCLLPVPAECQCACEGSYSPLGLLQSRFWARSHCFCGILISVFLNYCWCILKWLDVCQFGSSASTSKTIACLLRLTSTHDIPRVLVSDKGPQFTPQEFSTFCQENGILKTSDDTPVPSSIERPSRMASAGAEELPAELLFQCMCTCANSSYPIGLQEHSSLGDSTFTGVYPLQAASDNSAIGPNVRFRSWNTECHWCSTRPLTVSLLPATWYGSWMRSSHTSLSGWKALLFLVVVLCLILLVVLVCLLMSTFYR